MQHEQLHVWNVISTRLQARVQTHNASHRTYLIREGLREQKQKYFSRWPIGKMKNYAENSKDRFKYWCFTVNNYSETDVMKLRIYAEEKCRYIVFGREQGEKKKTKHLQGYLQLTKVMAGTSIKNQSKVMTIWLHPANGSGTEARDYCLKEDPEAYQWGDFMDHPRRDKDTGRIRSTSAGTKASTQQWHALKDDIMKGSTELQMMKKYPHLYYKHHSGISKGIAIANKIPRRTEKTCVHVLVGPAGVGKTTAAQEMVGPDGYWYDSPNKIWWTGYTGQSSVVFDDFHGNYPFDNIKKLTDKYPLQVPVHNGMVNFNSKLLVITTNEFPSQWYRKEVLQTHGMNALYRRINVLQHWSETEKKFVDCNDSDHSLWTDGCVCPPKVLEVATPELDLEDSEFVPLDSMKRKLSENQEIPNPKKTKIDLRHKTKGLRQSQLPWGMDSPDPDEVIDLDAYSSFSSDSEDDSGSMSEDFA